MIPTKHGTLKSTLKQTFFVIQRDGTYIDNHYYFQELQKQFNPSEGYPRFFFQVLNITEGRYVPIRFGVVHFWAIPQGEKGSPFSAWVFVFRIKVEIIEGAENLEEVLSRHDVYRIVRGMLTRFIWGNSLFTTKLYLEDLGPFKSPDHVDKGQIIDKVSFQELMDAQAQAGPQS